MSEFFTTRPEQLVAEQINDPGPSTVHESYLKYCQGWHQFALEVPCSNGPTRRNSSAMGTILLSAIIEPLLVSRVPDNVEFELKVQIGDKRSVSYFKTPKQEILEFAMPSSAKGSQTVQLIAEAQDLSSSGAELLTLIMQNN